MYALVFAALATAPAQPPAKHDDQNPLFKNLVDNGITAGKDKFKFAKPLMADDLDAAAQEAVIKKVANDGQYSFAEFTRNATVAPQLMKINDLKGNNANAIPRAVDVCFVAHGDFKLLEDEKFLDKLMSAGNKGNSGKSVPLNGNELAKRNIVIPKGQETCEAYGAVEFDFLGTVRLKATGHAMWSRNGESLVAAAEIDPKFLNDKDFPNEWRPLNGGKAGDPNPWDGAAMYLKITKLKVKGLEGAMFIEQHIIYVEPQGWFNGGPQLRSKLPAAVQTNVRAMRDEFKKAK